jgi:hypothetical protein
LSVAETGARRISITALQPAQKQKARPTAGAEYTSKIIKAGALLPDAKALLAHWDLDESVPDNLRRIRSQNLFGKTSRSRVEDILGIFRQRYLSDPAVIRALVVLVTGDLPAGSLDRIFYFHAVQADRLLRDVVTEVLLPQLDRGITSVDVQEIEGVLMRWADQGKTRRAWSEPTTRRIAQGLLSTLRDFGVLQGAAIKRIAPVYIPVEAFAYVAFYLKQREASGLKLLDLPEWKLFFLTRDGVERCLFEAHQRYLLEYHAAGTVTRLTFPASSLEEYAHVLVKGAH